MARPSSPRFPSWLWLIALAGLLLSLAGAQQARRDAEAETLQRLAFSADQVALRVEERLAAYALILRGASALFDASETVDRDEWRIFGERLQASALLGNIEYATSTTLAAWRQLKWPVGWGSCRQSDDPAFPPCNCR